ncbi:SDR family oxidoreductase [Brevibacillus nitrificans]|uniref:SDR family oxidoreductase n=1 Tax=Brevibacillus nitrificans TaxID=651560 RepID=UPI00261F1F57|nr:SDR family oxidoreductase [Brevibacillus nitrificans]
MKPINEQTILVTGATDGIGIQTAIDLAARGATVIVHGRSDERGRAAVEQIVRLTGNENIRFHKADFSSLAEVKRLAAEVQAEYASLDVLINNAGIGGPGKRALSRDGYELQLAVNYLAPFLLTGLLLPMLVANSARIVNVASSGQKRIDLSNFMLEQGYSPFAAYQQSKLALVAFTFELAETFRSTGITCNCLHPGTYLDTKMVRESGITPLGSACSGADAVVYLAVSAELERVTGKYFDRKKESCADKQAYDDEFRRRLWELSARLTGLE